MGTLKIASAGEDVAIFNTVDYSIINRYAYDDFQAIKQIAWSPDSKQIVAVPQNGETILLTLVSSQILQHANCFTNEDNTVAKFDPINPRFLGIGTKKGRILLWDIKNNKLKKSFLQKAEVTCLQFNWNASYIASGGSTGTIHLFNTVTGHQTSRLRQEGAGAIESLQYNCYRKAVIASSSSDGNIYLWDANSSQVMQKYMASHHAPATGVCFSPTDKYILGSVGLDKKLKIYDLQTKNAVSVLEFDNTLTCIDINEDGITVVVGDSAGNILLHDLRSSKHPCATVHAHDTLVTSLMFQNTLPSEMTTKSIVHRKDILDIYKCPSTASRKMSSLDATISGSGYKYLQKKRCSITLQAFSPIKHSAHKTPRFQYHGISSIRQCLNFSISSPMLCQSQQRQTSDNSNNLDSNAIRSQHPNYENDLSLIAERPRSDCSIDEIDKSHEGRFSLTEIFSPMHTCSTRYMDNGTNTFFALENAESCSSVPRNRNDGCNFIETPDVLRTSFVTIKKECNLEDVFEDISLRFETTFEGQSSQRSENSMCFFSINNDEFNDTRTSNSKSDNKNTITDGDVLLTPKMTSKHFKALKEDVKQIFSDCIDDFHSALKKESNTYFLRMTREQLDFQHKLQTLVLEYEKRLKLITEAKQLKYENEFFRKAFM